MLRASAIASGSRCTGLLIGRQVWTMAKETEELVKRTSGAKRVVVSDHTLRSAGEAMREEKQISGPTAFMLSILISRYIEEST